MQVIGNAGIGQHLTSVLVCKYSQIYLIFCIYYLSIIKYQILNVSCWECRGQEVWATPDKCACVQMHRVSFDKYSNTFQVFLSSPNICCILKKQTSSPKTFRPIKEKSLSVLIPCTHIVGEAQKPICIVHFIGWFACREDTIKRMWLFTSTIQNNFEK